MLWVSKADGTASARMAECPWAEAVSGVRNVRLIEHATQAETGPGQQSLVFTEAVFAGQLVEHFAFQQAAVQQTGVEPGQATGIAMTIGGGLLHAPPFRFIGAGHDRRRVGERPGGHGRWLAHGHLQQALGRSIADVALAPGDVRHTVKLFVRQADMEIQAQRLGDPRDDGLPGPRPSARRSNSPTSQP